VSDRAGPTDEPGAATGPSAEAEPTDDEGSSLDADPASGSDVPAARARDAGVLAEPVRRPGAAVEAGSSASRSRRAGQRATLRIGLTGPIGCGKSTVARWLSALGAAVVDADVVSRSVTAPDGTLDRAALARIVFADPAALADLEAIVHPAVRPRILAAIEAAEAARAPVIVVEAIRLVEGGLAALCDEVWLVTCEPAIQRERLLARGMPSADADRRISAQAGLEARLRPAATRVLDTSGPPAETAGLVTEALERARGARLP
jgi:dephospho-CoA kinase